MKKWIYIAVAIVIIVFTAGITKDLLIKVSVEKGIELVTGLKLNMASFHAGILSQVVSIKELKLLNPKNFPDKTMLNMPEIYVKYDLPAILSGKIHIPEARIDLREFMVVKNADGVLNLDSLNVVKDQKSEKKGEAKEKPAGKAPEMLIDTMSLKIGKVVYKDYSRGGEPSINEFDLNIDENFKNIDNPASIVSIIMVKALMNTTIGRLSNFDIGGLKNSVSETLSTATKAQVTKISTEATKTATTAAATATKEVSSTVQDATESVSKAAGNLLGAFGEDKK